MMGVAEHRRRCDVQDCITWPRTPRQRRRSRYPQYIRSRRIPHPLRLLPPLLKRRQPLIQLHPLLHDDIHRLHNLIPLSTSLRPQRSLPLPLPTMVPISRRKSQFLFRSESSPPLRSRYIPVRTLPNQRRPPRQIHNIHILRCRPLPLLSLRLHIPTRTHTT